MKKKNKKIISPFFLDINTQEKRYLKNQFEKILTSGKLILDKFTEEFEYKFAKYVNTKYAICVNSGTTALEILLSYYIKKKMMKVAVPTNTNFATVASIIKAGGYPVYLDMTLKSYCSSYDELKNIFLIEDCAHAHGSKYNNIHAGSFKDGGAFSFFPTKVMTTIEGGLISTNDIKLRDFAISMRNQGKGKAKFGCYHIDMGNSWRMSEISALMGILQLKKLNQMIKKRSDIYKIYTNSLKKTKIKFVSSEHMNSSSNYKFIIVCKNLNHLTKVKNELKKYNIITGGGVYELPCHKQPVFKKFNKFCENLTVAENFCPLQICLPLTSGMSQKQAKFVINKFINIYDKV